MLQCFPCTEQASVPSAWVEVTFVSVCGYCSMYNSLLDQPFLNRRLTQDPSPAFRSMAWSSSIPWLQLDNKGSALSHNCDKAAISHKSRNDPALVLSEKEAFQYPLTTPQQQDWQSGREKLTCHHSFGQPEHNSQQTLLVSQTGIARLLPQSSSAF